MKHVGLLLTMAMAASARGESSSAIDRSADGSPIREASSAPRRHSGSPAIEDELDSFNSSVDRQRGMYVSAADDLISILRETEEDRSSPHSPPIHFEIEVDLSDDQDDEDLSHFRRLQTPQAGERSSSSTLLLQLATAASAITPETTFDFKSVDFPLDSKAVSDHLSSKLSVLVNDPTKTRGLTVLSVNTESGKVTGIQRGRSGNVRKLDMFELHDGEIVGSAAAEHPVNWGVRKRMFMGPMLEKGKNQSFTCGVEHKDEWDDRMLKQNADAWKGVRGRQDEDLHDNEHGHKHHDHDHEHQEHDDHFNIRHLQNLFSSHEALPAFKPPTNQRLYEEDGPAIRFQINMIIDIDAEFIQKQGGPAQAIEYVNFLVTVANAILENEVGVRLHVVHIQEVTYFAPLDNLRDGLRVMREQYHQKFPDNVQLRHALLGRYMGGGIAFIDAVCDKKYGVGLSSGLEGRIDSLDEDAVYDLFIMMHEIGHSLGSDHTFESEAFNPRVDTCGLNACPKELPLSNSASIMSYCDFCSGGLSNVALSMGGVWNGEHPRLNVKNWEPSMEFTELTVSKNPERVSHQIWKTLYGKGQCIIKQTTSPTLSPLTKAPTKQPVSSSPTLNPITSSPVSPAPTTATPTVTPITASPTAPPTVNYGPFHISPLRTCDGNCYLSRGIMFDVGLGANAGKDILVESITFEHTEPTSADVSIDLYRTFVGSYEEKEKFSAQWNQLDSIQIRATDGIRSAPDSYTTSEFKLDPPVELSPEDSFGFYVRASSSILRVGTGSNSNVDKNGVFIGPGSTVMGGVWGIGIEGYLFNVNVKYSITQHLDTANSPTKRPITAPEPTSGSSAQSSASSLFASPTVPSSNTSTAKPTSMGTPAAPAAPSFWIRPSNHCSSNCLASSGFMFDLKVNLEADQILVKSIEFEHLRGRANSAVDVFVTYNGSLQGKTDIPSQWKKAATVTLPNSTSNTTAIFDPPISMWSGTTQGFYLQAKEGILLVGLGSSDFSDANGVSIEGGNVVFGEFGKGYNGYHLNARVGYDIKNRSR